jgi:hypothetical protein
MLSWGLSCNSYMRQSVAKMHVLHVWWLYLHCSVKQPAVSRNGHLSTHGLTVAVPGCLCVGCASLSSGPGTHWVVLPGSHCGSGCPGTPQPPQPPWCHSQTTSWQEAGAGCCCHCCCHLPHPSWPCWCCLILRRTARGLQEHGRVMQDNSMSTYHMAFGDQNDGISSPDGSGRH